MTQIRSLFPTRLYQSRLSDAVSPDELAASCLAIAEDDAAGQAWCEEHVYPGYSSYSSLTDLPWRFPFYADVVATLDTPVEGYAKRREYELASYRFRYAAL